ncbi:MAG: hypothetical protein IJC09_06190 [Clostridia bacterium]|nr:hypothetical protein [Clostridia bacterium]
MVSEEHSILERALIELDSHIKVYNDRAQKLWKGRDPERYSNDMNRVELFRFLRKEIGGVIPQHTVIQDGKYYCPSCGPEVGAIYEKADEVNMPVNFCPCCMQAFKGRV